ncbi:MAG TPA: hypothetical protein VGK19_19890 [Capsulimonadaceae bacterium]|jgi:hypothetical protein
MWIRTPTGIFNAATGVVIETDDMHPLTMTASGRPHDMLKRDGFSGSGESAMDLVWSLIKNNVAFARIDEKGEIIE